MSADSVPIPMNEWKQGCAPHGRELNAAGRLEQPLFDEGQEPWTANPASATSSAENSIEDASP